MLHGAGVECIVRRDLAATLGTAAPFELYGRALDAPKGAEHAAVARRGSKQFVTRFALKEEDAGVCRHCFLGGGSAFRAGDDRVQRWLHGAFDDV